MGIGQLRPVLSRHSRWLLILGALVCALVSFSQQPPRTIWSHTWSADNDPLHLPIITPDSPLHRFRASMDCPASRSETRTLLSTSAAPVTYGYLEIDQRGTSITLELEGKRLLSLKMNEASCIIDLDFNGESGRVNLNVGERRATTTIDRGTSLYPLPRITAIHADEELRDLNASVDFQIWTAQTSPTAAQKVSFVVALILLGAFAVSLSRRTKAAPDVAPRIALKTWPATFGISVTTVAAMFIAPPIIDDGWLTSIARKYGELGFVSNYFHHSSSAMPQGNWLTSLSRLWLSVGDSVLVMRSASALCTVATWLILLRWVLKPIAHRAGSSLPIYLAAISYLPWVAAPMMTLRYEPVMVLMWSVALVALLRLKRDGSPLAFTALLIIAALSVTAHQTGWPVASLAAAGLFVLIQRSRDGNRVDWATHLASIAIVGLVSISGLLVDNRFQDLLRSVREFADSYAFQRSYLNIEHWLEGIGGASNVRTFAIVTFLVLFAALIAGKRDSNTDVQVVRLAAIASLASLTLTSSKWAWHLTIFAPVTVVLVAVLTTRLFDQTDRRHTINKLVLLALGAVILAGIGISQESKTTLDYRHTWVLLVLLAVAFVPFLMLRGRQLPSNLLGIGERIAVFSVLGPVLVVVATTWGPRIAEVNSEHWTLLRQNLRSIVDPDNCGVLDELNVTLPGTQLPFDGAETSLSEFELPTLRGVDVTPFDNVALFTTAPKSNPEYTGTVITPWQRTDGVKEVVFWALDRWDWTERLTVEVRTSEDEILVATSISGSIPNDAEMPRNDLNQPNIDAAPYWLLNRVSLPKGTTAVRMKLLDTSTVSTEWVATTAFMNGTSTTLRQVYEDNDRAGYAEANTLPFAPCIRQPDLIEGLATKANVALGRRTWGLAALHFEYPWVELGCREFEDMGYFCGYLIGR